MAFTSPMKDISTVPAPRSVFHHPDEEHLAVSRHPLSFIMPMKDI